MKAPYLLFDISLRLSKCKVYKLAKAYLRLLKFLSYEVFEETNIIHQIQTIDPSIYIPRFIRTFGLKESQSEIIYTTCKLLTRLSHDWMAEGNRPSSLCSAAISIAAKYHGFDITVKDTNKVKTVCSLLGEEKLRKRLSEFKKIKFQGIYFEEFDNIKEFE